MADANDLYVLAALARFGHLRLTELARAGWPLSSVAAGQVAADRVVKRLQKKGHILKRLNAWDRWAYVLAVGGVARLARVEIAAQVGDKLCTTGMQYAHQTLGSRYLLERAAADGSEVWGWYAIGHGLAPVSQRDMMAKFGKVPDGLCRAAPAAGAAPGAVSSTLAWIEVENNRKSSLEVRRVIEMATHSGKFLDAAKTVKLGQVVIVYSSKQGHEDAMLRAVESLLYELTEQDGAALLAALVFARCEVEPGIRWSSYKELSGSEALAHFQARRVRKGGGAPVAHRPRVLTEEQRRREEEEYQADVRRRQKLAEKPPRP